tara:strand:- start:8758 stop:9453 length:696 start_codon:yes stop_codon:yes gene_type:complete
MSTNLDKRNIIVTGGTGALGRAVVTHLLERGASVWIPCFEGTGPEFDAHDRVHQTANVDLSKEDEVKEFFSKVPSLWASIHVAGGFAMAGIAETSLADFERMWLMNTASCFLSCREAVVRMRESGQGGRIVNVAARPAVEPVGGMLAYTTSKAGVASLTQCLAREVAAEGIAVNAILPAIMDTPGNRAAMPDADHTSWPKTEEIADAIGFLVSPSNATTSGTLVPVYGKLL